MLRDNIVVWAEVLTMSGSWFITMVGSMTKIIVMATIG